MPYRLRCIYVPNLFTYDYRSDFAKVGWCPRLP